MTARPGRPGLAECQADIAGRMEAGQPFDEVEEVIELADMSEDQKAALWLMAFCMRDRRDQQRDVRGYLTLVGDR
jgi:hypothetical protein